MTSNLILLGLLNTNKTKNLTILQAEKICKKFNLQLKNKDCKWFFEKK